MIGNYLKTAVRNLLRHKLYTSINLIGLALGLTGCVLIAILVRSELGFDAYHSKADRIYRVLRETKPEGSQYINAGTSGALAGALKSDFPDEVEQAIRTRGPNRARVVLGDKNYYLNEVQSDPEILDIFDLPLLTGDRISLVADPGSAVVSEHAALTLWGTLDVVGRTFKRGNVEVTVSGVMRDMPRNSSIRFDILRFVARSPRYNAWTAWRPEYSFRPIRTYLLLRPDVDAAALEAKLPAFNLRHQGKEVADAFDFHLQSLKRIHLHSRTDFGLLDDRVDTQSIDESTSFYSDITYVRMFALMALFLLIVAAVNFVSLATARSAHRAKEVGMRKVLGAVRTDLIRQFLGESIILSTVSFIIAVGLSELLIPVLGAHTGRDLAFGSAQGDLLLGLGAASVLVGLVAGCYPAFFLSAFRPVSVLRGAITRSKQGVLIRRVLVYSS